MLTAAKACQQCNAPMVDNWKFCACCGGFFTKSVVDDLRAAEVNTVSKMKAASAVANAEAEAVPKDPDMKLTTSTTLTKPMKVDLCNLRIVDDNMKLDTRSEVSIATGGMTVFESSSMIGSPRSSIVSCSKKSSASTATPSLESLPEISRCGCSTLDSLPELPEDATMTKAPGTAHPSLDSLPEMPWCSSSLRSLTHFPEVESIGKILGTMHASLGALQEMSERDAVKETHEPIRRSTKTQGASMKPVGGHHVASQTRGLDPSSTVMVRNLPTEYTRTMFIDLLDREGFFGLYDFVYFPTDFKLGVGMSYAFVNLASGVDAQRFFQHFNDFSHWTVKSDMVCTTHWTTSLQGLQAHIDRYRDSPVMHASVPDECKPALFSRGVRVSFPPPTRRIKAPRSAGRKVVGAKVAASLEGSSISAPPGLQTPSCSDVWCAGPVVPVNEQYIFGEPSASTRASLVSDSRSAAAVRWESLIVWEV